MNRISTWLKELKNNRNEMRYAKREMKKGYLYQLLDMFQLRFGRSKLGVAEYYYFRLFDDNMLSPDKKREFVGWRRESEIDKQMNLGDWRAIANDKLLFYSLMKGLHLPYPKVNAVYLSQRYRYLREGVLLNSIEDIKDYLKDKSHYPMFMKPIQATFGRGAISALEYSQCNDSIIIGNGRTKSIDGILQSIDSNTTEGYIFSELLRPHPELERLCGPRLSSVRVIVLLEEGLPRLFRAVWKIPTGKNVIDNFMHGRTGNLVASVDICNGRIERVVTGTGSSLSVRATHPDTNKELIGVSLPYWSKIKRVCMDGASAFSGLRMQHWDIALCPNGPVALEVNVEGSLDLHQIAAQQGIYDEKLRNIITSLKIKGNVTRNFETS